MDAGDAEDAFELVMVSSVELFRKKLLRDEIR